MPWVKSCLSVCMQIICALHRKYMMVSISSVKEIIIMKNVGKFILGLPFPQWGLIGTCMLWKLFKDMRWYLCQFCTLECKVIFIISEIGRSGFLSLIHLSYFLVRVALYGSDQSIPGVLSCITITVGACSNETASLSNSSGNSLFS